MQGLYSGKEKVLIRELYSFIAGQSGFTVVEQIM
jgi:hypothetical protein